MVQMKKGVGVIFVLAALSLAEAGAQLAGVDRAFDPSTIYRTGNGTFRVFCTGRGILQRRSSDGGKSWTSIESVFTAPPAWWSKYAFKDVAWAPDVIRIGDRVFLYYSLSTLGSRNSCIALAVNETADLSGPWVDKGIVLSTTTKDNYNAIDPTLIQEPDGRLWMAFGSYWSGIKLIELDAETGLRKKPAGPRYDLASRGSNTNRSCEAAALMAHPDGGYLLFVNWGTPPHGDGSNSTYEVRMGRANKITGPYRDASGKSLLEGGGQPFLDKDRTLPQADPQRRIGSGHIGVIRADLDGSGLRDWMSYFYYASADGTVKLGLQQMNFGSDGWPVEGAVREVSPCAPW